MDAHSNANFADARTTDLSIRLRVDFSRRIFFGYVDLHLALLKERVGSVQLDIRGLSIDSATLLSPNSTVETPIGWTIPTCGALGHALRLSLPATNKAGDTVICRVRYQTSPELSTGLQWFDPSQTTSKKHPFVYSQFEAILARTFVPCQDTPAVKAPYSISITCPSPLVAACSGNPVGGVKFEDDGALTYSFRQPQPIPSYLIAVVCGALEKASIGPRSSVWCEKPLLEGAVNEFSVDTEKYIQTGEKITGVNYDWGTYDLVVLPAAFPYGGMENPQLTFISSSLIAGDRSLTNVVAHEIAHSWSGNYVTNNNWSDFWINEGFTVYLERMILGEVHDETYRHFEVLIGYNDLIKTVEDLMPEHAEWTKLQPSIAGEDPDDSFCKVPYEKGSLFLLHLEFLVGGSAMMKAWLKAYFTAFRTKSVDSAQVKEHFLAFFKGKVDDAKLDSIDWDHWLNTPGMPKFNPNTVVNRKLVVECEKVADKWLKDSGSQCDGSELDSFMSKQKMYFLDVLITSPQMMSGAAIEKMDLLYGLSKSGNVEIFFRYLMLGLKNAYKPCFAQAAVFLSKHGRGLYTKPLFKRLVELDQKTAREIFHANKHMYHHIIRHYCSKTLAL